MSTRSDVPKLSLRKISSVASIETESPMIKMFENDGKSTVDRVRSSQYNEDDGLGSDSGVGTPAPSSGSPSHNGSTIEMVGDIESQPLLAEDKDWDKFVKTTDDTQLYSNEGCIKICKKVMKLTMIVVLFLINLGAMVVNKGSVLYITSNVNVHTLFTRDCLSENANCTCGQTTCADEVQGEFDESVRWIWSLYLCMVTPYVFGFLRCLWKISFKKKNSPTKLALGVVFAVESLHTVGLCLLLFLIMPNMDVTRALFITTAVGLIPSCQLLLRKPKNQVYRVLDVIAMLCQLFALFTWPLSMTLNPSPANADEVCFNESTRGFAANHGINPYIAAANANPNPNPRAANGSGVMTTGNWSWATQPTVPSSDWNSTVPSSGSTWTTLLTDAVTVAGTDEPPEDIVPPDGIVWLIFLALPLISIVWWGNFVDQENLKKKFPKISMLRKQMHSSRTKTYAIISVWKVILSFVIVLITYCDNADALFTSANFYRGTGTTPDDPRIFLSDWLEVYAIQTIPPLVCVYCADLAIKANLQVQSFSIPILLATPITYGLLLFACFECSMWDLGTDLYWNCFHGYGDYGQLMIDHLVFMGFLWWISQLWITRHIWTPKIERLAKMDKIFVLPLYCGPLLDQALAFNRRIKDREKSPKKKKADLECQTGDSGEVTDPLLQRDDDKVPMIYMCATMWHETEYEMIQILKSVFRMDFDQKSRKIMKEHMNIYDPDYYDVETHIFFDDAFEGHEIKDENNFEVNKFVKQLMGVLDNAASSFHNVPMRMKAPIRYPTPYGGRLVWTLPGDTKLIVHLKDKIKIRHRKRWSQVMYMYYLFGHRLMAQGIEDSRKEVISENAFVLALDGDVDFKPDAVIHLIDLMKRNSKVGAACGRIHPIGSGLMLWYQKFEYALGHWLQKATEHVLGCVLCSPGCFSLFRACALMAPNVMATYSKKAEEAKDYVQYDQGEDRWLCTLLLQQGYRVEYAAAADAMTYAPEGFDEFFNQRKRWTPSTFANILDLLRSSRATVQKNQNISMLYMFYQGGLFASSILGPATIFLLIVGAFNMAFGFRVLGGFLLVFIPLLCYFILCLKGEKSTQLYYAMILSAVFAIVQMVVLAGIIIEIAEYGLCSLSTMFMLFVVGEFFLAAILHPQEFFNIIYGPVYYLCIPTMYLLLIIYSLCNLNDVNWGTREVVKTAAEKEKEHEKEMEKQAKEMEAKQDDPSSWKSFLKFGSDDSKTGSQACGCGSLFQCMCCLRPGQSPEGEQLTAMQVEMTTMRKSFTKYLKKNELGVSEETQLLLQDAESSDEDDNDFKEAASPSTKPSTEPEPAPKEDTPPPETQDKEDTNWIEDPDLGQGKQDELPAKEKVFWSDMIATYLEPLELSKFQKEEMAKGLNELRNKAVFGFFIIDALVIALIIVLQVAVENGSDHRISWNCTGSTDTEVKEYYIDPIAITFLLVFGSFMVIQLFGMIFHRVFSFMQIVASTEIIESQRNNIEKVRMLVRGFMRLEGVDPDSESQAGAPKPPPNDHGDDDDDDDDDDELDDNADKGQPSVVKMMSMYKPKIQQTTRLDQAFSYRFTAYATVAKNTKVRPKLHAEMMTATSADNDLENALQRARSKTLTGGNHDVFLQNKDTLFKEEKVDELSKKYNITVREKQKHMRTYMHDINQSNGVYEVPVDSQDHIVKDSDSTAGSLSNKEPKKRTAPPPPSTSTSSSRSSTAGSSSLRMKHSSSQLTLVKVDEDDNFGSSARSNPAYESDEDEC